MPVIGYHCSHEQYAPSQLLRNVKAAARAGFGAAMCSDHFNPWSERQGHSGFAWSWLGSALEATGLSLGTVCAPGQRYHPAVIAQAAATLCDLYPGRFWLALGSGEALNETVTGAPWPSKDVRRQRLEECIDAMRLLWAGETVTRRGLVNLNGARLYSRPAHAPLLVGACLTPETARWVGGWADAMITVTQERARMEEIIEAFRAGGGAGKPMFLQVVLSHAPTHDEALRAAHDQWRQAALDNTQLADLDSVAAFDRAAAQITPADVATSVRVSASVEQHAEWLAQDIELGFERLYLHNVHRDQERFIGVFAESVLPAFSG